MKTVAIAGTFDSKYLEFGYLQEIIQSLGLQTFMIHTGVFAAANRGFQGDKKIAFWVPGSEAFEGIHIIAKLSRFSKCWQLMLDAFIEKTRKKVELLPNLVGCGRSSVCL
ncbi:Tm-1-like ATP-binding domain-containing protein [Sporomusa termitida]|uniref:UPF0261 domain-containing protein n=1 Tax=Sporomusa termitida TaxID=2377 RepID=A0A517DR74_9FIRM|nr:Tm-1-like ATP-binding domain-containing protein [Sporomusa termitida]QDR79850.1 hypothetical protein SPTER_11520 [Sporomusa termitida]